MLYRLQLSFADGPGEPTTRYVARQTTMDAVECAIRWIRFVHNTSQVFHPLYDRWEVQARTCRGQWIPLASGDLVSALRL